jgi:hypothetical protein
MPVGLRHAQELAPGLPSEVVAEIHDHETGGRQGLQRRGEDRLELLQPPVLVEVAAVGPEIGRWKRRHEDRDAVASAPLAERPGGGFVLPPCSTRRVVSGRQLIPERVPLPDHPHRAEKRRLPAEFVEHVSPTELGAVLQIVGEVLHDHEVRLQPLPEHLQPDDVVHQSGPADGEGNDLEVEAPSPQIRPEFAFQLCPEGLIRGHSLTPGDRIADDHDADGPGWPCQGEFRPPESPGVGRHAGLWFPGKGWITACMSTVRSAKRPIHGAC